RQSETLRQPPPPAPARASPASLVSTPARPCGRPSPSSPTPAAAHPLPPAPPESRSDSSSALADEHTPPKPPPSPDVAHRAPPPMLRAPATSSERFPPAAPCSPR